MANNTTGGNHPGMMGDGTEEQNLGQPGNPDARIKKDEVEQAFSQGDKDAAGGAKGGSAGGSEGGASGQVDSQVSNDMSDAKATPEDKLPKDNSHNFN